MPYKIVTSSLILTLFLFLNHTLSATTLTTWTHYTELNGLPSNNVYTVVAGADNTIWVGTMNAGVAYFAEDNWHHLTKDEGLADNSIQTIMTSPSQTVLGHMGGGITTYTDGAWHSQMIDFGTNGYHVKALTQLSDGAFWVGHYPSGTMAQGGGLSFFDGARWSHQLGIAGVSSNAVNDLVLDSAETLWVAIGTYMTYSAELAGGIAWFDGEKWGVFSAESGLANNDVHTLAFDHNDTLWAGTSAGVSHFDGTTWTTYTTADNLIDNHIHDLAIAEDGTVWAATPHGVSYFDGNSWINITIEDGLISNDVRALAIDQNNTIWFGTNAGVSQLNLNPTQLAAPTIPEDSHQILFPIILDTQ